VIFESSFSGAWRAFMSWFLVGASGDVRYLAVREALGGLRARDLTVREPVTVDARSTLATSSTASRGRDGSQAIPSSRTGSRSGCCRSAVVEVPRAEWERRSMRE